WGRRDGACQREEVVDGRVEGLLCLRGAGGPGCRPAFPTRRSSDLPHALIRVSPAGRPEDGAIAPVALLAPQITLWSPNGGARWTVDTGQRRKPRGDVPSAPHLAFRLFVSAYSGVTWQQSAAWRTLK